MILCDFVIINFIGFIEALAHQLMGLFKGDQQYYLGIYLANKFAERSGDVSYINLNYNNDAILLLM